MRKVKVSAPGKLHLLGEHSVVYGKPAIIAAVDKRCFVEITQRGDNKIKITSKNFEKEMEVSFEEIYSKFEKAQKDWDSYNANNDIPLLKSITNDPLDYSAIVIGQFFNYHKFRPVTGFDLIINSEIPVGAGMGSSGALAASMIGALTLFAHKPFDKEQINKIAFLCEQKKHGKPSGGDNSASTFGGMIWYIKNIKMETLDLVLSKIVQDNFFVIDTGTPRETTGEMVSLVGGMFEKDPNSINKILDDQEKLVHNLLPALKNSKHDQIIEIIKKGEANLEKLGVVSDYAKQIIRDIEKSGGAAKICGGGGITKDTGMVLVYGLNDKLIKRIARSYKLDYSHVKLGAEGVRIE